MLFLSLTRNFVPRHFSPPKYALSTQIFSLHPNMQICNQIWLFTDSHRCKRCRDQTQAWLMLLQFFAKNGAQGFFFLSKNRIRTTWNRFPDWYMCIFSLWLSRMMMGWSDLRHSLDEPIALSVISHHVWWRPPSCRTMKSKTGNQWFTRLALKLLSVISHRSWCCLMLLSVLMCASSFISRQWWGGERSVDKAF